MQGFEYNFILKKNQSPEIGYTVDYFIYWGAVAFAPFWHKISPMYALLLALVEIRNLKILNK
jgi:hypothetical protein